MLLPARDPCVRNIGDSAPNWIHRVYSSPSVGNMKPPMSCDQYPNPTLAAVRVKYG